MKEVWVAFKGIKGKNERVLAEAERVKDVLVEMRRQGETGYMLEKRKVKE